MVLHSTDVPWKFDWSGFHCRMDFTGRNCQRHRKSLTLQCDNDSGFNNHSYNDHGYNNHGCYDYGFNDHSCNATYYNRFSDILKKHSDQK